MPDSSSTYRASKKPESYRTGTAPHGETAPKRASVPPSEPPATSSRTSFGQIELTGDRPVRLQMAVALILGLVLVAIPLYLWRRPRAESIAAVAGSSGAGAEAPVGAPAPAVDETPTVASATRVVSCHDAGPKKTAPEQCDRLPALEKALTKAVEDVAGCVPKDVQGTIVYVVDANFKRRTLGLTTPKEGRSIKLSKVVQTCQALVKARLPPATLDLVTAHEHARYKVALSATYPPSMRSARP